MTGSFDICAVLFDADCVLQKPVEGWQDRLATFSGSRDQQDEFMRDFFEAEISCKTGDADFADVLVDVLARWNFAFSVEEVIETHRSNVEVDSGIMDVVRALKRSGIRRYLTTNQQEYRAQYMSEELGYAEIFDGEFYSCRVGYKKPSPEYFRAVLDAIGVPAGSVLFIDDSEANVVAAQELGIQGLLFEENAGVEALDGIMQRFGIEVRSYSTS